MPSPEFHTIDTTTLGGQKVSKCETHNSNSKINFPGQNIVEEHRTSIVGSPFSVRFEAAELSPASYNQRKRWSTDWVFFFIHQREKNVVWARLRRQFHGLCLQQVNLDDFDICGLETQLAPGCQPWTKLKVSTASLRDGARTRHEDEHTRIHVLAFHFFADCVFPRWPPESVIQMHTQTEQRSPQCRT